MSNNLYLFFWGDVLILFFLVFKYLKALDRVVGVSSEPIDMKGGSKMALGHSSKLALLSDFKFVLSLYTGSYRCAENQSFIKAMDQARKYLIWQIPFAIVAFSLPIVSKVIT